MNEEYFDILDENGNKIGETKPRTIVSGIAKWYNEENLTGKIVVVVTNLRPVKLRGIESNGMLLAAGDGDVVKLITVDGEVDLGSSVH